MSSLLIIIPVAASAFIATNLDNLVLLVSLLARYQGNRFSVIAGYLVCALLLGLAGFSVAAVADLAPVQYLGLLGIVPITIGAMGIVQMIRGVAANSETGEKQLGNVRSAFAATLLIQLSNGSDTVVTFAALFADSAAAFNLLIISTMVAMAIVFAISAMYAVRHPLLGEWIEKYGPRITPFILIFVGCYILLNTATDLLPE